MTAFSSNTKPHHTIVSDTRALVRYGKPAFFKQDTRNHDLKEISEAHESHIRAGTDYHTVNSDRTMINLIGTWARLSRVIIQMEEKYG